jgi:EAL domain-containing protein (putative c-di-GMP-specific phosphodiesterase class I)
MSALQHFRLPGYPALRPMLPRKLRSEIRSEPAGDPTGLQVWYQPLYNLRTLAQTGTEALIRRQDPGRGLQLPSQFLPEGDAGALMELDLFVLTTVLEEAKELLLEGCGGELTFHVNLRPTHLENETFVSRALELLDEYRVPPPWLVFEITENQPLDLDRAVPHMEALRRRGCQFALDDFGSGFSNLHYLARLPVRWLKLDRSLITDLPGNPRARTVAHQVLGLSRALDSRVIAEGIETPEQRLALLEMGCEFGQGFLLGRPEPRKPAARTCDYDPVSLPAARVAC